MILDGEKTACAIQKDLTRRAARLKDRKLVAGLTAIRVGGDPASELYVSRKMRACEEIGIGSKNIVLDESVSEEELLAIIRKENDDPATSGILVQLPLPAHVHTQSVIEAISPAKDVDGFHPFNVGRVATGVGGFACCTPKGILRLLDEYGIDPRGKRAVIVGASNIVGRPLAGLLVSRLATVTICHSETKDLAECTRSAEILAVGVGRANMITKDMVSRGVVIVDVGINRIHDSSNPRGFRVAGDVAPVARELAFAWTPVPGGIGPMTVAMLMENTLIAAEAIAEGKTV